MRQSTVRSAFDSTFGELTADSPPTTLQQVITTEWHQSGQPDLVVALRRHPVLLRDRSLLLNLAIEEYRAQRRAAERVDLEQHCHRFREFGSSIQRSILRQLEAQRYIDEHPELLEALCTPRWPKFGEEFGNFHVLEELGFGATAHVYLCLQTDVGNRKVVVKATPFSSFEASILGRLNHPNIIPILSTGAVEDFDLHYLCMPYCGRSTLTDLLDVAFQDGFPRRDKPIAEAARRWIVDEQRTDESGRHRLSAGLGYRSYIDGILKLAIQIAEALEHAHRQRILHGDLKPSNVLLTPDGRPLLLDFNLSHDSGSAAMCGGTLPYMPPEQLRQVAGHEAPKQKTTFDATSDIYSFGALLYELLAGVLPVDVPGDILDAPTMANRLLARLERCLPPARQRNPLISPRLESVLQRCLAFDPSDRPLSMTEVKRQLQTEARSLAAIGRTARVRPFFFSAVVGVPLVMASALGAHFAVQPARYVADYERGLRLAAAGDFEEAVDYFASAIGANPSFAPARFQLARARVTRGELDLAINDFGMLARAENDSHSMAYLGYCFNLRRLPVAAIPWYERAIRNGARSVAIYNNLGASYLEAPTRLKYEEQLSLAEYYLLKALELDDQSPIVQLNLVRHAETKSQADPSYNPFCAWRRAAAILANDPEDQLIRSHVTAWYGAVCAHERVNRHRRSYSVEGAADAEQAAHLRFADLIPAGTDKPDAWASTVADPRAAVNRYFLEPLLLDDARP